MFNDPALHNHQPESMLTPSSLNQKLLREGWELHQRLIIAAGRSAEPSASVPHPDASAEQLRLWCKVVAPDDEANFAKRLAWSEAAAKHATRAASQPKKQARNLFSSA